MALPQRKTSSISQNIPRAANDNRRGPRLAVDNTEAERNWPPVQGIRGTIIIEPGITRPAWFEKVYSRGWVQDTASNVINRFSNAAEREALRTTDASLIDDAMQLFFNDPDITDFSQRDLRYRVYVQVKEWLYKLYKDTLKNPAANIENVNTIAGKQQAKYNQPQVLDEEDDDKKQDPQYQEKQAAKRLKQNRKRVGKAVKLAKTFGVRNNIKRFQAFKYTFRIWSYGFFWAWFFVQLPFAVAGAFGFGGEVLLNKLWIVGELISYFVPGELILATGMVMSIIIGWSTLVFALVYYKIHKIPCFSTGSQIGMFVLAMGFYVAPLINILPCAMLWMLFVIVEAGD